MELLTNGRFPFLYRPLVSRLDKASRALLLPDDGPAVDFTRPAGEPAFAGPDSVSWRIFKNPVCLFTGGVAAVILELAEPRVRAGVWEHTGFRTDPVRRIRRTGLAAMITVYGPQSVARASIARVRRMHDFVRGVTPSGEAYTANDPELLEWVHATAAFGFAEAYRAYAGPLSAADLDRYYSEGAPAAALYGVSRAPDSEAEVLALFGKMRGRLEPSPIVFEFLEIMRKAPVLPPLLRPAQPLFVAAAVSLTPAWVRQILGLPDAFCLRGWPEFLVKQAGAFADKIVLESSPAVQSCLRLGLPANYLFGNGMSRPIGGLRNK
ncbi:MAG: oxygenase MpaB family protein [Rhodomicrobium sp.]